MLGRALLARCPVCGGSGLFVSWFQLRERCSTCGQRLERGESHDYWIGGMMFNIALAEGIAVMVVGTAILATWPRVPWNVVWFGSIALMLASPLLFYPISRLVWLAFDLTFRQASDDERGERPA